ncbi:MAG: hypothetical protein JJE34_05770 [Alphaproteobacteria bacterium]|nr:hypothetical protein [Alphaproteobacteria bacterium]
MDAGRYYLGGRTTLFVIAAGLIVGGIASNWGWLVAAGIAPILIAFLPCAVMCALGLCMHKMGGGAHTKNKSADVDHAAAQPQSLTEQTAASNKPSNHSQKGHGCC